MAGACVAGRLPSATAERTRVMRATATRPNARLLSLRQAEAEYGIPYAQLLDLAKRGELAAVQPPNVRRVFLVRADLERKLDLWKVA
jgi:hypothetical protein